MARCAEAADQARESILRGARRAAQGVPLGAEREACGGFEGRAVVGPLHDLGHVRSGDPHRRLTRLVVLELAREFGFRLAHHNTINEIGKMTKQLLPRLLAISWLLALASACAERKSESVDAARAPLSSFEISDKAPTSVSTDSPKPEPLPAIDTRSPDSVVKSYWALTDWLQCNQNRLGMKLVVGDQFHSYMKKRMDLGTGEFRSKEEENYKQLAVAWDDEPELTIIQRDIIEVKNESETRAVVLTKLRNITPVPSDLDLRPWDDERKTA